MLKHLATLSESVFTINRKRIRNSITPFVYENYNRTIDLINTVTSIFTTLTDLINFYNQIFGWQILILLGVILMSLLESFNLIMIAQISQEQYINIQLTNKISSTLLMTCEYLVKV